MLRKVLWSLKSSGRFRETGKTKGGEGLRKEVGVRRPGARGVRMGRAAKEDWDSGSEGRR